VLYYKVMGRSLKYNLYKISVWQYVKWHPCIGRTWLDTDYNYMTQKRNFVLYIAL
jgi:hypothetical protein